MKTSQTLIAAAVAALIAGTAAANDQFGKDKSSKSGATFSTLDANGDGRISRTEASADAAIDFTTADANGDGYLSTAEFKQAMMKGKESDSSMPAPQPQSEPTPDTSGQPEPSVPQDQSASPPADTETPRQ